MLWPISIIEMKRIALILILGALYCTDVSSKDCSNVQSHSNEYRSSPGHYYGKLDFVPKEFIVGLVVEIKLNRPVTSLWGKVGQTMINSRGDGFQIVDRTARIISDVKCTIEFYINYPQTLPIVVDVIVNGRSICLSGYSPSGNFFSSNDTHTNVAKVMYNTNPDGNYNSETTINKITDNSYYNPRETIVEETNSYGPNGYSKSSSYHSSWSSGTSPSDFPTPIMQSSGMGYNGNQRGSNFNGGSSFPYRPSNLGFNGNPLSSNYNNDASYPFGPSVNNGLNQRQPTYNYNNNPQNSNYNDDISYQPRPSITRGTPITVNQRQPNYNYNNNPQNSNYNEDIYQPRPSIAGGISGRGNLHQPIYNNTSDPQDYDDNISNEDLTINNTSTRENLRLSSSNYPRRYPSVNMTSFQYQPELSNALTNKCGVVDFRVMISPLITHGELTQKGEWPWHVAIYRAQDADNNKYKCGGTLVSASHVITAAHCVIFFTTGEPVNHQTLTVYLGKYDLGIMPDHVQVMLVKEIFLHPQFNHTNLYADMALLKFNKPSEYTRFVRPICLWKESETNLDDITDRAGTVVGWGIDEDGKIAQQLTSVKMPVIRRDTCIFSLKDFFSHYLSEHSYCAGYRNGSSVCNGDSGGGMVFSEKLDGETTWSLRGIVSMSRKKDNEEVCDTSHYVVFTDIVPSLKWIKEKIG